MGPISPRAHTRGGPIGLGKVKRLYVNQGVKSLSGYVWSTGIGGTDFISTRYL